jgi:UPF0271 protein
VVGEGFADRGYRADGTLVPRTAEGALIHDPDAVVARAVRMAVDGLVETSEGEIVPCRVSSICVHGDTPGAVELAGRVRTGLTAAGVEIRTRPSRGGSAGGGPARPA